MPNSYSRRNRSNNSTLALLSKPPLAPAPQVEGRLVTPGGVGQHSPAHGGHHSIAKPTLLPREWQATGREGWKAMQHGLGDEAATQGPAEAPPVLHGKPRATPAPAAKAARAAAP